ncbi:hypothetical protein GCK72_021278 [Caenorhabditis remanei]|uniref:C2H2-type domain-containing protein n=1 Tax=Caenorhabditis remanei TaxID=31234 RepID=A0A6A5GIT8_CAERE|nr:hypothetical protein GCK72_021278 [Caenorhabditis remanei]KAF1754714.1 hypothetical protein GCK72_021278 [Caenorhabditis remanei]
MNLSTDPKTGESNAVALLLCRGTGECDLNFTDPKVVDHWRNVAICDRHVKELLTKWDDSLSFRDSHIYRLQKQGKKEKACSMPDEIGIKHLHARPGPYNLETLNIDESDVINKHLGYLVHPGIPICQTHKKFVADLKINMTKTDRKKKLGELSRQKKVCTARKMIDGMLDVISGGDSALLKKKILTKLYDDESWTTGSSKNFDLIMKQVAAQFYVAHDRRNKRIILSIVANVVPYSTVEKYIPSLNRYMYHRARLYARQYKENNSPASKDVREKYNRIAVQFFVDFITSPTVMIGLPYGVKKVKMTNGTKQEIPNTIRQQSSTEIYEMYKSLLKNTNQTELMLSRSSVFRILDVCVATDRRATTCVDYFTANGMEVLIICKVANAMDSIIQGFDGLHEILDKWIEEKLFDQDSLQQLKTGLFEAAQYLRTDYRLHVKKCSRVADHCATLALSDPMDKSMASSCSTGNYTHKYDLKCERCEQVNNTLNEIESLATQLTSSASLTNSESLERRKGEMVQIKKYIEDIFELKKHYLRAAYTNQEREDILSSLKDNEALITLDFAQKYLPRWHREKQSDYYGKKGISYHVAHTTARIGDVYTQHSFVHIYSKEVPQDSKLVVMTLLHVLRQLKKVGIIRASIRSDNAGAYHCAATINSLHWLMEMSGVSISTYTFSEAQNGKSSSDRDASRVKRKAENYVAKDGNIMTSEHFFSALTQGRLLNGMSIYHGYVTVNGNVTSKWPGISNLNHFTVEKNGIRGRRYGSIGSGQLLKKESLNPMNGTYHFEEAGFTPSKIESNATERTNVMSSLQTKFWYHSKCSPIRSNKTKVNSSSECIFEDDNTTPEIEDSDIETPSDIIGKLYSCPEVGCSASFLRMGNLEAHVLRGKHKLSPVKLTLRDAAFNFYSRNIEEVGKTRTCPMVGEALEELKETSNTTFSKMGWALPRKQTRKAFEPHVKQFLVDCFEEGLTGKRLDPRTVEKRMRTQRKADGTLMFTVEERKDYRQIAGFFSREAEKRRVPPPKHRHRRHKASTNKEDDILEEEHDDAGWIRFLKDESFWTESDEFFYAIQENEKSIFQ